MRSLTSLILLLALTSISCSKPIQSKTFIDTEMCASGCFLSESQTLFYQYFENSSESLKLKCDPINAAVRVEITPRPAFSVTTFVENDELFFDQVLDPESNIRLTYECEL